MTEATDPTPAPIKGSLLLEAESRRLRDLTDEALEQEIEQQRARADAVVARDSLIWQDEDADPVAQALLMQHHRMSDLFGFGQPDRWPSETQKAPPTDCSEGGALVDLSIDEELHS